MVSKRLNNLELQISYDDMADVLYISFGDPRPGIAIEPSQGDFVRIDPYTDEIVGITILDFKERYMPSESTSIEDSARSLIPRILEKAGLDS